MRHFKRYCQLENFMSNLIGPESKRDKAGLNDV